MPRTCYFCIVFALVAMALPARAQIFYGNGATIVTKPGSIVQVNGSAQINTGSLDDSGTVTITANFTNSTAATAGGSGLYNIAGNFTDNGTFVKKTGTVNLNGTTNQNVGGTTITTFYNLQFTNGGSKTLTQQEIVDSDCYFTNGICFTTNTDVLHFDVQGNWINNSGMPVSSCISYVDGPCEKDMNSTNLFWFPVGKQGRANTCSITPQSSTATTYLTQYFNVSYVNTTSLQSPLVTVSKVQYWFGNIESGSANAIIKLYWIPGDYALASYMSTPSNIVVARWDTLSPLVPGPRPAWLTAGVSALQPGATYNSGWIQSAVVTAAQYGTSTINRPFTLGSLTQDNSLPVEMGPFAVKQVENHMVLDWTTYSEIESLGFELDRSRPGGDGVLVLGTFLDDTALMAKSPYGANYETIDDDGLTTGIYTYDLYQIDKNGTRTHVASESVDFSEIDIPNTVDLSVYPNPATQSVHAEFGLPADSYVQLDLYDAAGRKVMSSIEGEFSAGPNVVSIDVSNLASGVYNIILTSGNQRVMKGIVIQK
jgi:Secretion system C-terminal sorting domain